MTGFFITLEGPEGAGKTTQANHLIHYLQEKGFSVLLTREPGGTAISDKIRSLLLDPANGKMVEKTEILLYAAARAQHLQERILPALAEGKVVICDRFADSTFAYQGYGRGLDVHMIETVNDVATEGISPDLTFLLMVDVEEGLTRATREEADRLEQEQMAFHHRVACGYQALAQQFPERIVTIGAGNIEEVRQEMIDMLDKFLTRRKGSS